jgi:hypothetical protein
MQRAATVGHLLHGERVHSLTIVSLTGNTCNLQQNDHSNEGGYLQTLITSRNDNSIIGIKVLKKYNELEVKVQGIKLQSTSDNIDYCVERQKQICLEFSHKASIKPVIKVLNYIGKVLYVLQK